MKTLIQQSVIVTLLLILVIAVSRNFSAVVVPPVSEEIKSHDARLQQIVVEMTLEQKRHQERLENIKKELQQLESHLSVQSKTSQDKRWIPGKIAMVLNQKGGE